MVSVPQCSFPSVASRSIDASSGVLLPVRDRTLISPYSCATSQGINTKRKMPIIASSFFKRNPRSRRPETCDKVKTARTKKTRPHQSSLVFVGRSRPHHPGNLKHIPGPEMLDETMRTCCVAALPRRTLALPRLLGLGVLASLVLPDCGQRVLLGSWNLDRSFYLSYCTSYFISSLRVAPFSWLDRRIDLEGGSK